MVGALESPCKKNRTGAKQLAHANDLADPAAPVNPARPVNPATIEMPRNLKGFAPPPAAQGLNAGGSGKVSHSGEDSAGQPGLYRVNAPGGDPHGEPHAARIGDVAVVLVVADDALGILPRQAEIRADVVAFGVDLGASFREIVQPEQEVAPRGLPLADKIGRGSFQGAWRERR